MATHTGWTIEYIKKVPLYQLLQILASSLVWEGNDLKWKRKGEAKKRLRDIIQGE